MLDIDALREVSGAQRNIRWARAALKGATLEVSQKGGSFAGGQASCAAGRGFRIKYPAEAVSL